MTDSITPEQWLKIANEVEPPSITIVNPELNWHISGNEVVKGIPNVGFITYVPDIDHIQQLRIDNYLVEKGVYIVKIGTNYEARTFWGGEIIASSKEIMKSRALAVLALIGEE